MTILKKYLLAAALAGAACTPAAASNITYDSYSTPDGASFNSVTTTANGASDTPYSYYTGPITFQLHGGGTLTVYCSDLNHILAGSGTYSMGILDHNGEGQTITEFDSNRIGHIAALGEADLTFGDPIHLDDAAAAQEAIWQIAYGSDNPTFSTSNAIISNEVNQFLSDHFQNTGYASALVPLDPMNNQLMVVGAGSVPEPSTWAMGIIGFAVMGAFGWKRHKAALSQA